MTILHSEVTPKGIRLWQGFRSKDLQDRREDFIAQLQQMFVPATIQMMEPLGLCGYFPALLPPSSKGILLPDEIALVIYPSPKAYNTAARLTPTGRAYGALHGTVFNFTRGIDIPPSTSSFSNPWDSQFKFSKPYALIQNRCAWRSGSTRLLVAKLPFSTGKIILKQIHKAAEQWRKNRHRDIDGSLLVIEPTYLIYWEHYKKPVAASQSFATVLAELCEQSLVNRLAKTMKVPAIKARRYDGVKLRDGEVLNVLPKS